MTRFERFRKRFTIVLVLLLLIGGAFLLVRGVVGALTGPPAPTCFDGIQNQNETGVDCGGSCPACFLETVDPVLVERATVLPTQPGFADVAVWLRNPNTHAGAARVPYTITLQGSSGVVGETQGEAFLLPGTTEFFVHSRIPVTTIARDVTIDLAGAEWQPFEQQPRVSLTVTNTTLDEASVTDSLEGRLRGVVRNDSSFDLDTVDVAATLRDNSDAIVAAGRTTVRTLRSGEERAFEIAWPVESAFESAVSSEVRATTNIFSNENILLEYGAGTLQPFQQF